MKIAQTMRPTGGRVVAQPLPGGMLVEWAYSGAGVVALQRVNGGAWVSYLTAEACAARYPQLTAAVRDLLGISQEEAASHVRDARHYPLSDGWAYVVAQAFEARHDGPGAGLPDAFQSPQDEPQERQEGPQDAPQPVAAPEAQPKAEEPRTGPIWPQ